MTSWLRTLSIALAVTTIALATTDADAQRRRGRRARGRTAATAEPAETTPAEETEGTVPPPDPFADPATAAPAAQRPPETTGATSGTGTAATPPVAPGTAGATAPTAATPPTSATPPTPPPAESADPGPTPPDLAPIRQEYVQLMDEMVQARSRVAIVGQELFQTRMTITVQDRTGDEQTLTRFLLELDGTPIHRTDGEIEGGQQGRQVFEGALAPGPHVLTIDMEQRARDDPEYRTTQRESFRFIVVRDRLSEVTIILEDDSNIARDFRSGGEGGFDVRTRLRVATRELPRS